MNSFNIFSERLTTIFRGQHKHANDESRYANGNLQNDKFIISQRALWRAVILQAIIDILNTSVRTEHKIAKLEAKKWIFTDNEDFKYVCLMSGYKINYIRKKVMEIMRKNLQSRITLNKYGYKKENKFFLIVNWHLQYKHLIK